MNSVPLWQCRMALGCRETIVAEQQEEADTLYRHGYLDRLVEPVRSARAGEKPMNVFWYRLAPDSACLRRPESSHQVGYFGESVLRRLDMSREVSRAKHSTWSTLSDHDHNHNDAASA